MGNQTLGRGKVLLLLVQARYAVPAGFRYIGNTPSFNLTIDNQKLEHFSSDEGIRKKDKSIILETTQTGNARLRRHQPGEPGAVLLRRVRHGHADRVCRSDGDHRRR
jgi:hypothetical protein